MGGGSKIAKDALGGLVPATRMKTLADTVRRTVSETRSTITYRKPPLLGPTS